MATKQHRVPGYILPTIVLAQLFCTSLWFASNAVSDGLAAQYELGESAQGYLTSLVQLGFIVGTLVSAALTLADRIRPSVLFLLSAWLGAVFTLLITLPALPYGWVLVLRFLTGACLAGIYPVGMKIAADHYGKNLGPSLGFLLGALVLGTGLPHLLKLFTLGLPWRAVFWTTAGLAAFGGLAMVVLVPNGPYRSPAQRFDPGAFRKIFASEGVRRAALGYFGHMWELYTYWAFMPLVITAFVLRGELTAATGYGWAFAVFGIGAVGCVLAARRAQRKGHKQVATLALASSGACCALSPLVLGTGLAWVILPFLLLWGLAVMPDSPLFSTLVALNAPPELKGTALTLVNSLGFAISILSLLLMTVLLPIVGLQFAFVLLLPGPVLGLLGMWR